MNEVLDPSTLTSVDDIELEDITWGRISEILQEGAEEKKLQDILDSKRRILFARLSGLEKNPFHNRDHAFAVHNRVSILLKKLKNHNAIPLRNQLLLLEWALRHDDGHVGNRYRQDIIDWDSRSNEEYAVDLMFEDFAEAPLWEEEKLFLKRCILATSSWQKWLPVEDPRYRNYGPETLAEKLLVFADVWAVVIEWWEAWNGESIGVNKELWVQSQAEKEKFFTYVVSLYEELKEHFWDDFCRILEWNIEDVRTKLRNT